MILSKEENTTFLVFSLISHQEINILLFVVFMILGKLRTPGDIPPGVFCYSYFTLIWTMNSGGISLGVFYFPRIIKTPNNRIFISSWVINENTGNDYLLLIKRWMELSQIKLSFHLSLYLLLHHKNIGTYSFGLFDSNLIRESYHHAAITISNVIVCLWSSISATFFTCTEVQIFNGSPSPPDILTPLSYPT